jgi:hypothetical protein
MASANPSSARLSRSTSDLSGVNRQRAPEPLPLAYCRWWQGHPFTGEDPSLGAVRQVWEEGQAKEQGQEQSKGNRIPPPAWLNSTPISTVPNITTARAVPCHDNSSPLPLPRTLPQHPSRIWFCHWFRASQTKSSNSVGHIASR